VTPREEGQAAVELALVLPFVGVLLLGIVQVALVVRDQVLTVHAAREAARQAAVDPDPAGPRRAALAGSPLEPGRLSVEVAGRGRPGSRVRVSVRYRSPTRAPLIGPVIPDVVVTSSVTMRTEV
jgi:Flp pilus assembly pilin Flp